ncbi:TPA: hypothetical protein DIC20_00880 [Candidatus Dependentiae bacterium]|nr:MAG: hypothetical protein US03_C0015G0020 [candidate division TM6 bacterium GW2011_GWF2_36_131]KKQ02817.1 MAG: hypothetical protein US13_C0009G0009 [candidate division TM6 bacterium GW2011_GWE2_36_25]KKQ18974.1 MAG: hypothetical protein US32_C0019G0017 [candidate division TM6 bacterium GW2011_GWA2_36_9]HBR70996.1 hypothetical protein [Candidatus Dependentiae bacterium]HCU00241.1 hypothetical protein [Candidatus Dependentiae bacterium]
MRKILIVTLLLSTLSLSAKYSNDDEYPNTPPVVGSVKAAAEAPADIVAGLGGKSIYEDEDDRLPIIGGVEAAGEGAANIVTSFFGKDIHKK